MRDIKRYCDAIAAAFKPRKIILFGSYAYGKPNEDSDVDVMVVMPKKRYRRDLDFRVRMKVPAGFPGCRSITFGHRDSGIIRRRRTASEYR